MNKTLFWSVTLFSLPFFYVGAVLLWVFYAVVIGGLSNSPTFILKPLYWVLNPDEINTNANLFDAFFLGIMVYFIWPVVFIIHFFTFMLIIGQKYRLPANRVKVINQTLYGILWGYLYLPIAWLGLLGLVSITISLS